MAKKNTIAQTKSPVVLRQKELANGNKSLYLDIYHNGKRKYEFLKLYLVPERGTNKVSAKQQNKNTLETAEAIKSKRYRELLNDDAGLERKEQSKVLLLDWVSQCLLKKGKSGIYKATSFLLSKYIGNKQVMLKDVDKAFCRGFIEFVNGYVSDKGDKHLTQSSKAVYLSTFRAMLNFAEREELILSNPYTKIAPNEKPHRTDTKREFLEIEEVKRLVNTNIKRHDIKQAFLFSCFTGLRISDIRQLKWSNIICSNGRYHIELVMQKTKESHYIKLSNYALEWLPKKENQKPTDLVFSTLPSLPFINTSLTKWVEKTGITKHITFHCARHTFATLNLTSGVDLYTTSKLLGHKDIKTTTIYAKIIDQKKDEAVDSVSRLFE